MDINWSVFDGLLGILILGVIVWAAFKLVKRIVVALIVVALIAAVFFGVHWGDFGVGA